MELSNSYTGNFRGFGFGTDKRVSIRSVKVVEMQGIRATLTVGYLNTALNRIVRPSGKREGVCAYSVKSADTSLTSALEV